MAAQLLQRPCQSPWRVGRHTTGRRRGSRAPRGAPYHARDRSSAGARDAGPREHGARVEEPERKDQEDGGGSLLGEVSVVTLIVAAVTILAIVGYGLLLLFELFF